MRIALVIYFWASGAVMFFVGARDVAAPPAHLGQPVSSLLNEAHMQAVVAGDPIRKKEIEAGMKHLQGQIDLARGHLYSSPYFLLGFGVLHFAFGAAAIIVKKSRSSQHSQLRAADAALRG